MENSEYRLRNRKVQITTLISLVALLAAIGAPQFVNASNDEENPKGTCYEMGYNHGQNGDFDHGIYNDGCYGEYNEGFIDGCMSISGNTKNVCESASD